MSDDVIDATVLAKWLAASLEPPNTHYTLGTVDGEPVLIVVAFAQAEDLYNWLVEQEREAIMEMCGDEEEQ